VETLHAQGLTHHGSYRLHQPRPVLDLIIYNIGILSACWHSISTDPFHTNENAPHLSTAYSVFRRWRGVQ